MGENIHKILDFSRKMVLIMGIIRGIGKDLAFANADVHFIAHDRNTKLLTLLIKNKRNSCYEKK